MKTEKFYLFTKIESNFQIFYKIKSKICKIPWRNEILQLASKFRKCKSKLIIKNN